MVRLLYEDESILIIDKPSGMLVHRGWGHDSYTLVDAVKDHTGDKTVFPVHRLDRGTSGAIIFARSTEIASRLQNQFKSGSLRKRYLAIVRGKFTEPLILDHEIKQREKKERVAAITHFIPLAYAGGFSLVESRPLTGKQHQIRRHLKHLSCPIIGDVRYGKGDINQLFRSEYRLERLALHSLEISFNYTVAQSNRSHLSVQAPLPEDLKNCLVRIALWDESFTTFLKSGLNRS